MAHMTGFVFQDTYPELITALTKEEIGSLVLELSEYHRTGKIPEFDGREEIAFWFIKADVDRIEKNYAAKSAAGKNNRKKRKDMNCDQDDDYSDDDHETAQNDMSTYETLPTVTNADETLPTLTNAYQTAQDKVKEKVKDKDKVKAERKETVSRDTGKKEEDFARFWSSYPRKQGKANAREVFGKIAPDEQLLSTMLDAIERQKRSPQWTRDGGQFIPLAATWLHGQRWEDEGIEVQSTGFEPFECRDYEQFFEPAI